jgi:hypothetical protein
LSVYSVSTWLLWAGLILIQNSSFTAVSRARNSGSYSYHATAAVFSNGIWFVQMLFVVGTFNEIMETRSPLLLAAGITWYTIWTVTGSVATHWFLKTHVERGNRKVGA